MQHATYPSLADKRVVITGYESLERRLLIADFDPATGRLTIDENFREKGASRPGFSFDRRDWPHGPTGPSIPHGPVFSLP